MLSEVVNALYITYLATEYNIYSNGNASRSSYNNNNSGRSSSSCSTRSNNFIKSNNNNDNNDVLHNNDKSSTYRRIQIITIIVVIWNVFDYLSGFGNYIHQFLDLIFVYHIPRIIFVATSYIVTLYYDCYYTVQRRYIYQQQENQQVQKQQQQNGNNNNSNNNHLISKESQQVMSSILSWKNFLPRIFRYFVRILPIYPFMAVVISFLFLFIISIFEILHLSTDILNVPIYYGTLYGPFSYIYYHVKYDIISEQNLSSTSLLPHHHHHQARPTTNTTLV